MLPSWLMGALAGSTVVILFGYLGVRTRRTLEQKLHALRVMFALLALVAVVVVVGLALTGPLGSPRLASLPSGEVPNEWFDAAREQVNGLRTLLAWLFAVAAMVAVPVVLVLRELQSFVLEHRLDLVGRDQARANAPSPPR